MTVEVAIANQFDILPTTSFDEIIQPALPVDYVAFEMVPQLPPPIDSHISLELLEAKLNGLLLPNGCPAASKGELFCEAFFGGDAIVMALDLLKTRPDIAYSVIIELPKLQGIDTNYKTGERKGKMPHEQRERKLRDTEGNVVRDAVDAAQDRMTELALVWNLVETREDAEELQEIIMYTNAYVTGLYAVLVAEYCKLYGEDILEVQYPLKDSDKRELRTVKDATLDALACFEGSISERNLLEYQPDSPLHNQNQNWKDGATSITCADGTMVNSQMPVALLDIQGIAADAFAAGIYLFGDEMSEDKQRWEEHVAYLQYAAFPQDLASYRKNQTQSFWMMEGAYYAMGLDYNPLTQSSRLVDGVTSTPGAFLNSSIWEGLPEEVYIAYVSAIVKRLISDDFITLAGIRCRSLQEDMGYSAYQGPTIWDKDVNDFLCGLERHGLGKILYAVEGLVLETTVKSDTIREFKYTLPDGTPIYHPKRYEGQEADVLVDGTNIPEPDQGWSITTLMSILERRQNGVYVSAPHFAELEEELLGKLAVILERQRGNAEKHDQSRIFIDTQRGCKKELEYILNNTK
jgi:glycogen debranching enzyme